MATLPAPTPAAAPGSPLDALHDAVEHTRRRLFPLRLERWLALGLLAFLDQCGRGGGSFMGRGSSRYDTGGIDTGQWTPWVASHLGLIVALAALGLTLVVALLALVLWINTRGIFMYLDAVVTGREDIGRPWREHAEAAGSLFVWRFALAVATLLAVVLSLAVAAALVLTAPPGEPPGGRLLGVLFGLLLFVLPLAAAATLASLALRDFVAPLQLHLRCDCPQAARVAWALVRAHLGSFVVYVLLKIVFALASGVVLALACCFTCCLAVVPVISQTLLQPLWYFERAWSVHLLRRMGYDLFASFPGLPPPDADAAPAR